MGAGEIVMLVAGLIKTLAEIVAQASSGRAADLAAVKVALERADADLKAAQLALAATLAASDAETDAEIARRRAAEGGT